MKARALLPFYDFYGKQIFDNKKIDSFQHKNFIEYVLTKELNHYYHNIKELRLFLLDCEYKKDIDHFNIEDYWMEPIHFENSKNGDCEDFALFTWKQLLHMGIDSRFVIGKSDKNTGHAWCHAIIKNKEYIIDPVLFQAPFLPSFTFKNYKPMLSIANNNGKPVYYNHKNISFVGDSIFSIFILIRVLFYIPLIASFLIAFIPLCIYKMIRKSIIRFKRRWT